MSERGFSHDTARAAGATLPQVRGSLRHATATRARPPGSAFAARAAEHEVVAIGSLASELLVRHDGPATVIGGGSAATYLRSDGGELLWLGVPSTPVHRRAVIVKAFPRLDAGSVAELRTGTLSVGGTVIVRLSDAPVWTPLPLDGARVAAVGERRARSQRLAQLCLARSAPFPLLWAACMGILREECAPADADDSFVRRARDPLLNAVRTAHRGNPSAVVAGLLPLVGLGPGLTPSGDDIVGGALFALRMQSHRGDNVCRAAADTALSSLNQLSDETHPLSLTLMRDQALGHGPAPLHDLAEEMLSGSSAGPQARTVSRVQAIGHSSGADLLTGFLIGMAYVRPTTKE